MATLNFNRFEFVNVIISSGDDDYDDDDDDDGSGGDDAFTFKWITFAFGVLMSTTMQHGYFIHRF